MEELVALDLLDQHLEAKIFKHRRLLNLDCMFLKILVMRRRIVWVRKIALVKKIVMEDMIVWLRRIVWQDMIPEIILKLNSRIVRITLILYFLKTFSQWINSQRSYMRIIMIRA